MSKRHKCLAHMVVSLLAGVFIYLFLRDNTLLHQVGAPLFYYIPNFSKESFVGDVFLRYYLPDALWVYSLQFGLQAIFLPSLSGSFVLAAISSGLSFAFEVLQRIGVVGGTGDWWDVITYMLAAIIAACIYTKLLCNERRKMK